MCCLLFGVCSTPVLPQWHVKYPGHSTKSAVGRLHLNTHTSLTHRSRSGLTMPLSRQSVEIYQETSSHATPSGNARSQLSQHAEPLWTDPGLKSGISLHELISTLKTNKKKRRRGINCRTFSQNPRTRGKSHHRIVHTAPHLNHQRPSETQPHHKKVYIHKQRE